MKELEKARAEERMEIWDLYDENGTLLQETWERSNIDQIPEGKYHMVCDVLIRNQENRFLLTLRDPKKDVHPGKWEASAGGAALAGETPRQAAEREMREETGLTAERMELMNITVRPVRSAIYYSFLADTACDPDSVRLQPGETVDYKWVDAAGLMAYTASEDTIPTKNERYRPFLERLEEQIEHKVLY